MTSMYVTWLQLIHSKNLPVQPLINIPFDMYRRIMSGLRIVLKWTLGISFHFKGINNTRSWSCSVCSPCVLRYCLQTSRVPGARLLRGTQVHHTPQRPRCYCGIYHQAAVFCSWIPQGQAYTYFPYTHRSLHWGPWISILFHAHDPLHILFRLICSLCSCFYHLLYILSRIAFLLWKLFPSADWLLFSPMIGSSEQMLT